MDSSLLLPASIAMGLLGAARLRGVRTQPRARNHAEAAEAIRSRHRAAEAKHAAAACIDHVRVRVGRLNAPDLDLRVQRLSQALASLTEKRPVPAELVRTLDIAANTIESDVARLQAGGAPFAIGALDALLASLGDEIEAWHEMDTDVAKAAQSARIALLQAGLSRGRARLHP